jgi:excisionase family DNA binding protein
MQIPTERLPRLSTAQEVAEATGIKLPHLYGLCRSGAIPHVRLGSRAIKFSIPAVRAWIESGGSLSASDAA